MFKLSLAIFLLLVCKNSLSQQMEYEPGAQSITVPLGGNAFATGSPPHVRDIGNKGIENWTDDKTSFDTYVYFGKQGTVKLWVAASNGNDNSRIRITYNGTSTEVNIFGPIEKHFYAGEWNIQDSGYARFTIAGLNKSGNAFANISNLHFSGPAIDANMKMVKNNEGNFFHWGRRGPSVHLNYTPPEGLDAEWFYNEVTVPEGEDVIGSYYMANGFGEGYFGIQVNSPTERRVLFSVWSPFKTDDPKSIPDNQKIKMLKKGEGVQSGEFGNEGSGGQSYLRYNWKAGTTYKFLLRGQPDNKGHTIYTAWFFAPEAGKWKLMASFLRPATNTYLKHLYSFLENFIPEQGNKERKVLFNNQWVRDKDGKWTELNKAKFTADNTARQGYRLDYAGGVKDGSFYLRNCGFFNDRTPMNTWFERPLTNRQPEIDLESLP